MPFIRPVTTARSMAFASTLLSALLLAPQLTSAQQSATLNSFRAAPVATDDFQLSRPTDLGHLRWSLQLHADYANDPLIFETDDNRTLRVVEHQLNLNLGFALGLVDRVVVFAGVPMVAVMSGDSDASLGVVEADGPGMGDLYLGGRVRIVGEGDDMFHLGAQLTATLPTSGGDRFRGEDTLSLRPEVLAEIRVPGVLRVVGNLGAIVRRNASASGSNLSFSDELTFGIGAGVPVWERDDGDTHLDVTAQLYGGTAFNDAFSRDRTVFEGTVGAKMFLQSGLVAGLAVGPGMARGFGSPDVRVIAMVGFSEQAEVIVLPTEPGDRDGDGLLDDVDQCPDQPEDRDEFQDEDGCPDPDNDLDGTLDGDDQCPLEPGPFENGGCPDGDRDGDGIVDRLDRCPDDAEDMDAFEDTDGCPDPDNDNDGIVDGSDRCPNEPGPVENRGCPDTDRDGDTVVDRLDNCPDEAGKPENHGCPNKQLVRIEEGRLEILDVVYFQTNKDVIERRSFPLLMNVAAVINAHPEIGDVRVEGHTDSRGKADKNRDLSRRRAEAVVRYLIEQGSVPSSRLTAQGFGPDRPIVQNARSAADHARNRRVEFNLSGEGRSE